MAIEETLLSIGSFGIIIKLFIDQTNAWTGRMERVIEGNTEAINNHTKEYNTHKIKDFTEMMKCRSRKR